MKEGNKKKPKWWKNVTLIVVTLPQLLTHLLDCLGAAAGFHTSMRNCSRAAARSSGPSTKPSLECSDENISLSVPIQTSESCHLPNSHRTTYFYACFHCHVSRRQPRFMWRYQRQHYNENRDTNGRTRTAVAI